MRMTRTTMLEVIRQDYIRTAKAKGASPRRVTYGHALRNALLPVVTVIGTNFGFALGGSIVLEQVFTHSWTWTVDDQCDSSERYPYRYGGSYDYRYFCQSDKPFR